MAIVREWRARLHGPEAGLYVRHFAEVVLPHLRGTCGFEGAEIHQGIGAAASDLAVATRWASLEAIQAFAGDDISRARVEDAAAALFRDFDRHVAHRSVIGVWRPAPAEPSAPTVPFVG